MGASTRSPLLYAALIAVATIAGPVAVDVAASSSPAPGSPQRQVFGVHPADEGRTTLPGGHFNFAVAAGESVSDGVVVDNFSDHSLGVHIYGADLHAAPGGGLAPAQPTDTMHEAGAWITVSTPEVTIPAHGQVTDGFILALPSAVGPGEHLGAVVAAADVGTTRQGSTVEARIALLTVITVPGTAHPSARLGPLSASAALPGQFGFGITLYNTGNLLLTYAGSVAVYDAGGRKVAGLRLTPADVYVVPTGNVPLAATWTGATPSSGRYSARGTVTILANGKRVGTLTSQALELPDQAGIPMWTMLGVALSGALILLAATGFLVRRGSRDLRQ